MLIKFMPILIAFVAISCADTCGDVQYEIKSIMGANYKKEIIFPKEMELVNPAEHPTNGPTGKKYKIVHFFTADCNKCVNELTHIQSFLRSNHVRDSIDLIFIASGPTKHYVAEAVAKIKFEYPIFYEQQYFSFKLMNDLPLEKEVYNTMILNDKNKVFLFGSYFSNRKAEKLFSKIIQCGLL